MWCITSKSQRKVKSSNGKKSWSLKLDCWNSVGTLSSIRWSDGSKSESNSLIRDESNPIIGFWDNELWSWSKNFTSLNSVFTLEAIHSAPDSVSVEISGNSQRSSSWSFVQLALYILLISKLYKQHIRLSRSLCREFEGNTRYLLLLGSSRRY